MRRSAQRRAPAHEFGVIGLGAAKRQKGVDVAVAAMELASELRAAWAAETPFHPHVAPKVIVACRPVAEVARLRVCPARRTRLHYSADDGVPAPILPILLPNVARRRWRRSILAASRRRKAASSSEGGRKAAFPRIEEKEQVPSMGTALAFRAVPDAACVTAHTVPACLPMALSPVAVPKPPLRWRRLVLRPELSFPQPRTSFELRAQLDTCGGGRHDVQSEHGGSAAAKRRRRNIVVQRRGRPRRNTSPAGSAGGGRHAGSGVMVQTLMPASTRRNSCSRPQAATPAPVSTVAAEAEAAARPTASPIAASQARRLPCPRSDAAPMSRKGWAMKVASFLGGPLAIWPLVRASRTVAWTFLYDTLRVPPEWLPIARIIFGAVLLLRRAGPQSSGGGIRPSFSVASSADNARWSRSRPKKSRHKHGQMPSSSSGERARPSPSPPESSDIEARSAMLRLGRLARASEEVGEAQCSVQLSPSLGDDAAHFLRPEFPMVEVSLCEEVVPPMAGAAPGPVALVERPRGRASIVGDGQLPGWSARLVLLLGGGPLAAKPLACASRRSAQSLLRDALQVSAELRPVAVALACAADWGDREEIDFGSVQSSTGVLAALAPLELVADGHPAGDHRPSAAAVAALQEEKDMTVAALQEEEDMTADAGCRSMRARRSTRHVVARVLLESRAEVDNARMRRVDCLLASLANRAWSLSRSLTSR